MIITKASQDRKGHKEPMRAQSMLCGRTEARENVSDLVARGMVVDLHLTG